MSVTLHSNTFLLLIIAAYGLYKSYYSARDTYKKIVPAEWHGFKKGEKVEYKPPQVNIARMPWTVEFWLSLFLIVLFFFSKSMLQNPIFVLVFGIATIYGVYRFIYKDIRKKYISDELHFLIKWICLGFSALIGIMIVLGQLGVF